MNKINLNQLPLISVIIPIYNVEKYLRECLDSVLAQTYKNLEIILIDDGSPDNCGKICDEYAAKDNRIKVIHQINQGVSAARNAGLDAARGEYIGFVDSDDYIKPDMYEYLYALISKDNADMAMCNVIQTDTFKSAAPIQDIYKLIEARDIFYWSEWMWLICKLFSTNLFKKIRLNTEIIHGEDALFAFEIAKKPFQVALGNQAKYFYRYNIMSASHTFHSEYLKRLTAVEKCLQYAKEHGMQFFYETRSANLFSWIARWLQLLAQQDNPDMQSVGCLQQYIHKHYFRLIFHDRLSIKMKCYLTLCCINFPLANKIYQLLKGNK